MIHLLRLFQEKELITVTHHLMLTVEYLLHNYLLQHLNTKVTGTQILTHLTLAFITGNSGDQYRVATGGTQNLGEGSTVFEVGDFVFYNGSTWDKIDNTESVTSVNGATGAVVFDTDDIAEGSTNLYD